MKAKEYLEKNYIPVLGFPLPRCATFEIDAIEYMMEEFSNQEKTELIEGIKEIAHIDDKYCCCTACKIAVRFNLKNKNVKN